MKPRHAWRIGVLGCVVAGLGLPAPVCSASPSAEVEKLLNQVNLTLQALTKASGGLKSFQASLVGGKESVQVTAEIKFRAPSTYFFSIDSSFAKEFPGFTGLWTAQFAEFSSLKGREVWKVEDADFAKKTRPRFEIVNKGDGTGQLSVGLGDSDAEEPASGFTATASEWGFANGLETLLLGNKVKSVSMTKSKKGGIERANVEIERTDAGIVLGVDLRSFLPVEMVVKIMEGQMAGITLAVSGLTFNQPVQIPETLVGGPEVKVSKLSGKEFYAEFMEMLQVGMASASSWMGGEKGDPEAAGLTVAMMKMWMNPKKQEDRWAAETRSTPGDPAAWNNLGAVQAARHHLGEARVSLASALSLKADFPEALYNLGKIHYLLQEDEDALATWTLALKHHEAGSKVKSPHQPLALRIKIENHRNLFGTLIKEDLASLRAVLDFEKTAEAGDTLTQGVGRKPVRVRGMGKGFQTYSKGLQGVVDGLVKRFGPVGREVNVFLAPSSPLWQKLAQLRMRTAFSEISPRLYESQRRYKIYFPSFEDLGPEGWMQQFRHELAHTYIEERSAGKAPLWLEEGLALKMVSDHHPTSGWIESILVFGMMLDEPDVWTSFRNMGDVPSIAIGHLGQEPQYAQSLIGVDWLIRQKGEDKIVAYLDACVRGRADEDFEAVFGMSWEKLDEEIRKEMLLRQGRIQQRVGISLEKIKASLHSKFFTHELERKNWGEAVVHLQKSANYLTQDEGPEGEGVRLCQEAMERWQEEIRWMFSLELVKQLKSIKGRVKASGRAPDFAPRLDTTIREMEKMLADQKESK